MVMCMCEWKDGGCLGRSSTECRRYKALRMREWRKTHPLTVEQSKRDNARSYAGVYKRRGKLVPEPCLSCGSTVKVEMHHRDYDKPLEVMWLCRRCHLVLTGAERAQNVSRETLCQTPAMIAVATRADNRPQKPVGTSA